MKSFEDLDALIGAVPFAIVNDLRTIDNGRGSEALYRDKLPALFTSLAARARVESIEASSAIEGGVNGSVCVRDPGSAVRACRSGSFITGRSRDGGPH